MNRTTVGIDNGQSGSVAVISDNAPARFFLVPTVACPHFARTKKGKTRRLDRRTLEQMLRAAVTDSTHAYVEKPYTSQFVNAVISAVRFYESTLCTLEDLGFSHDRIHTIASGDWQKSMLPGVKGRDELKAASLALGIELYPHLTPAINKIGDSDGLLIAHFFHHRTT